VKFLTHILCDSYWIMGDGRMQYIYYLLVNFPDNFLKTCTSIEQVNLPSIHNGKNIISTPGLTSYELSIQFGHKLHFDWAGEPSSQSHWKIYYIKTGIVTFLAHIVCDSYWIMGYRRMEYIYWLLVNFLDNFLTTCTSIEQVNLPYSHIGNIYYINTGIVTFLTHNLMWLLLKS
jgi:hypothetical protein